VFLTAHSYISHNLKPELQSRTFT